MVTLQMRLGVYIYFSLLFNVIAFRKISFITHRVIGTFGFKVVVLLWWEGKILAWALSEGGKIRWFAVAVGNKNLPWIPILL